ncbi:T9SS type A sorting domain-containing protein [Bacteroidota bacterium]
MKIKIILFLLIFFIGFSLTQAQRPPCSPDYTSLSYAGKIPDRFPLLKLDMPYETMLFYIWWSDWVNNYGEIEIMEYFHDKSFDDEFKDIIKRLYIAQDYNPVLFAEHLHYNDTLMYCPYCHIYYTTKRFYEIAPEPKIHYPLIVSEIISRVKITDIVEREFFGYDGYIITTEVQDVIKGKVIPACKDVSIPDTPDDYVRPDPYLQLNEPGKCFQFAFDHKYSEDFLEIGKDYIVFVDLMEFYTDSHSFSLCTDSLNNCYYISKITQYPHYYVYYIFPIKNDIVEDTYFLFSYGDSVTYNEWREKLQEKIDEILQKNYTSVKDYIQDLSDDVSVYPNPAFSDLNIFFNHDIVKPLSVKLYNNLGFELHEYLLNPGSKNELRINLNNFYSGIYYLKIIDNEKIHFKKFVVVK